MVDHIESLCDKLFRCIASDKDHRLNSLLPPIGQGRNVFILAMAHLFCLITHYSLRDSEPNRLLETLRSHLVCVIQAKQNGRRKLASISESEILRIQDDAVLQNTKRATKFRMKVLKGKRRVHTFANQCSTSFFQIIIAENKTIFTPTICFTRSNSLL